MSALGSRSYRFSPSLEGSRDERVNCFLLSAVFSHSLPILLHSTLYSLCPDSTSNGGNDDADVVVPLAVTTIALLVVAGVIGVVVAYLTEHVHNRKTIQDDASDISDYTRQLLKAQMLLFSKSKQKKKLNARELAQKYAKVWRAKTARNKARRLKKSRKDLEKGATKAGAVASSKPVNANVATIRVENEDKKKAETPGCRGEAKKTDVKPAAAATNPEAKKAKKEEPANKKTPDTQRPVKSKTEKQPSSHPRSDSDEIALKNEKPEAKDEDEMKRRDSGSSKSEYEFLSKDGSDTRRSTDTRRGTPHSISAVKIENNEDSNTSGKSSGKAKGKEIAKPKSAKVKTPVMGNVQSTDNRPKSALSRPRSTSPLRPVTTRPAAVAKIHTSSKQTPSKVNK